MNIVFEARNRLLGYFFEEVISSSKAHNVFLFALLQEEYAGGDERSYQPAMSLVDDRTRAEILKHQRDEQSHAILIERARATLGWGEDPSWPEKLNFSAHLNNIIPDFENELKEFPLLLRGALLAHIIEENAVNFFSTYRQTLIRNAHHKVLVETIGSILGDEHAHFDYTMKIIDAYRTTHDIKKLHSVIMRMLKRARQRWLRVIVPELQQNISSWRFRCIAQLLLVYSRIP